MAVKIEKKHPFPTPNADAAPFAEAVAKTDSAAVNAAKKVTKKAAKKAVVQPQAHTETKHPTGATTEQVINVGPPLVIEAPMANVGVSLAQTRNLGDYNNIKFSVSLFMPCLPTEKDVDNTFANVNEWVNAKMAQLNADLDAELDS